MNKMSQITLRFAQEADVSTILSFIKELASYEQMLNEVIATETILHESLFKRKVAEVILAEIDHQPVAFALFFHNFSTFLGKPGIYLEDLYVQPKYRGLGIGKMILSYLAQLAIQRDCGRLEWACLDWNQPSIDFYLQQGAKAMSDWTVYRVSDQALVELASKGEPI